MKTKRKQHSKFLDVFQERQENSNYSRLNRPEHWNISNSDSNNFAKQNQTKIATETTVTTTNDIQLQCLNVSSLILIHNRKLDNPTESVTQATSPGGSSLELEWEHEYAGTSTNMSWHRLRDETTTTFADGISDRYAVDGDEEDDDNDDENSSSEHSKNTSNYRFNHISRSRRVKSRENDFNNKTKTDSNTRSVSRSSWSHRSTPDSLEWDIHEDDQKLKSEIDDTLDIETIELLQEIEWLKNRALNETNDGAMVHLDDCNCELES